MQEMNFCKMKFQVFVCLSNFTLWTFNWTIIEVLHPKSLLWAKNKDLTSSEKKEIVRSLGKGISTLQIAIDVKRDHRTIKSFANNSTNVRTNRRKRICKVTKRSKSLWYEHWSKIRFQPAEIYFVKLSSKTVVGHLDEKFYQQIE